LRPVDPTLTTAPMMPARPAPRPAALGADLEHLGSRDALQGLQRLVDDQRAAQRIVNSTPSTPPKPAISVVSGS
jgi:hypothetical protein